MVTTREKNRLSPNWNYVGGIARTMLTICAALSSAVFVAALPLYDAAAQVVNLNGNWGSQYNCPSGKTLPLVLRITQQGQNISAVTAAADECLNANVVAFRGSLYGNGGQLQCGEVYDPNPSTLDPNDNSQSFGDFFAQALSETLVDSVAGPNKYAVRYSPGAIQVISPNSIVACTLVFNRVGTAPLAGAAMPAPAPQSLNVAGPMQFYCSSDGRSYAQGKGGVLCPTPRGSVPVCPHGQACTCMDPDGSCMDGDDDWGYRPPPPVAAAPQGNYPYPAAAPQGNYAYPAAAPQGNYAYPAATPQPGTYPSTAVPPPGTYPSTAAPAPGGYRAAGRSQPVAPQDALSKTGREQWQMYLKAADNKAFAMSQSSGSFGWRRARNTVESAKEGAIEACRVADCRVISVNGTNQTLP